MKTGILPAKQYYRLWIGQIGRWRPQAWQDVPPRFAPLEPADERAYSARHALAFLEGFNGQMLAHCGRHWAVAIAVEFEASAVATPQRLFSQLEPRRNGRRPRRMSPGHPAANRSL